MRGVLLGSALLALILTVLIVGVVRLSGMAVRRIRGHTKTLTAERRFAEAVAAGDFDRAELQAGLLLEPTAGPAARSPQPPPKPEGSRRTGRPCRFRRCRTRRSATAGAPMARPVVAADARRPAEAGMSRELVRKRTAHADPSPGCYEDRGGGRPPEPRRSSRFPACSPSMA